MEDKILNVIKAIRESFGASISVYTTGNCYQFYEILKAIFPEAEPYETGGHVFTKIDNQYYDIRGKCEEDYSYKKIVEPERILTLSHNKWSDDRRGLTRRNITVGDINKHFYFDEQRMILKPDNEKGI